MQFSLWDTIPGPYNPKAVGVFEEYDMTGVTTRAIRLEPKFQGWGASVGEVEFWVHDPGDFEATVEGLVETRPITTEHLQPMTAGPIGQVTRWFSLRRTGRATIPAN